MAKKKPPEPLVTDDLTDPRYEQPEAIRPGRPKGSKNLARPEAILRPAQCPRCKSTRRGPFRDGPVNEMHVSMDVAGEVFNHQLWRNTKCLDCGQNYRVIEYRFEPAGEEAGEKGRKGEGEQ